MGLTAAPYAPGNNSAPLEKKEELYVVCPYGPGVVVGTRAGFFSVKTRSGLVVSCPVGKCEIRGVAWRAWHSHEERWWMERRRQAEYIAGRDSRQGGRQKNWQKKQAAPRIRRSIFGKHIRSKRSIFGQCRAHSASLSGASWWVTLLSEPRAIRPCETNMEESGSMKRL